MSSSQSVVVKSDADAETSKLSDFQTSKPKKLSRLKSTADLEADLDEDEKSQQTEEVQVHQGDATYTKEGVIAALKAYGKTLQKQTEKFIVESDIELKDGVLTILLVNNTLMELFHELKQEILDFVRKEIKNGSIQIDARLIAEVKEAKPRTEQEKFKAMVEKNPVLKTFKDDLGLDLVY
ncbi:hypothetical protein [Jiulongibacter sediminis]|uniref:hypothetical protein n=1 Tax=Jiulongibacter sediminis TaxID=1605367 RepID=UPI0026EC31C3|nr:hypothetical protein [Jiulongibacter sediminis]